MTPEELLINAVKTHQKVDLFQECATTVLRALAPRRCMTLHLPSRTGENRPQYITITFTWETDQQQPVLVVRAPGDARVAIVNVDLWDALQARWDANTADRKRKEAEARALALAAITEGLAVESTPT
jgi:hypothetical protein